MSIREAKSTDLIAINALSRELGYADVSQDVAQIRLEAVLGFESHKMWVWEANGQIEGWIHAFIAYRVASSSFIEIGGLAVSPHSRRKGIGKSLVLHVKGWAQNNRMKLRVRCHDKRCDTQSFYSSVGFIRTKTQYVFEL